MKNLMIRSDTTTMSSLEIAELTGKRHSDVMRDVERILNEAGIGERLFTSSYKSKQNKDLPCYNLPRRECDLVVSGYSVKYRLAIIDRWQELEAANIAPPPPPKSALELAKEQVVLLENMERLELELKQSKTQLAITSQCLDESQTQLNMNREWASVKFVETKFNIKVDWRIVKSWNDHYGMEKKYIEDQNYGKVRTYHASAWKASYNIII